jgi:murein L,D-transpeptidase YafK
MIEGMIAALTRRSWLSFVLLAVCAGFALLALAARFFDWDDLRIEVERTRRLAYAAMGAPLPGTPDLAALDSRLAAHGVALGAPVLVRIFKLEFELELWMQRGDRFHLFATYPVCRWSGALGPKLREGDWQAPEGFYTVDMKALNPHSRWHRAFNLGFPNSLDQAHGRTGSYLMVHGGCSSIGCYAMTDPVIDEVWRLVSAALKRGQRRFHVHIFPFRLTEENLANRAGRPWAGFWRDLKPGYDLLETTRLPPRISICQGRYVVSPGLPGPADAATAIDSACPRTTGSSS